MDFNSSSPYPEGVISFLDTDLYKLTMQCAVFKYFKDVPVTYGFTNRTPEKKLSRAAYRWLEAQITSLSCHTQPRALLHYTRTNQKLMVQNLATSHSSPTSCTSCSSTASTSRLPTSSFSRISACIPESRSQLASRPQDKTLEQTPISATSSSTSRGHGSTLSSTRSQSWL